MRIRQDTFRIDPAKKKRIATALLDECGRKTYSTDLEEIPALEQYIKYNEQGLVTELREQVDGHEQQLQKNSYNTAGQLQRQEIYVAACLEQLSIIEYDGLSYRNTTYANQVETLRIEHTENEFGGTTKIFDAGELNEVHTIQKTACERHVQVKDFLSGSEEEIKITYDKDGNEVLYQRFENAELKEEERKSWHNNKLLTWFRKEQTHARQRHYNSAEQIDTELCFDADGKPYEKTQNEFDATGRITRCKNYAYNIALRQWDLLEELEFSYSAIADKV